MNYNKIIKALVIDISYYIGTTVLIFHVDALPIAKISLINSFLAYQYQYASFISINMASLLIIDITIDKVLVIDTSYYIGHTC